jgi:hypothetical protein
MVNSCHLATKRNRDVKRLKDFLGKLCSNSADMEAKTCKVILKDKESILSPQHRQNPKIFYLPL